MKDIRLLLMYSLETKTHIKEPKFLFLRYNIWNNTLKLLQAMTTFLKFVGSCKNPFNFWAKLLLDATIEEHSLDKLTFSQLIWNTSISIHFKVVFILLLYCFQVLQLMSNFQMVGNSPQTPMTTAFGGLALQYPYSQNMPPQMQFSQQPVPTSEIVTIIYLLFCWPSKQRPVLTRVLCIAVCNAVSLKAFTNLHEI